MNTTNHGGPFARIVRALAAPGPSDRLRTALAVGTDADPNFAEALVARCGVEPDFFVRDMLTWALCRLPAEVTVPLLIDELGSDITQARSQALHTLSKIGDTRAWPAVRTLLHDRHDDVARSAWRAAVAVVPPGAEPDLAADLATELGRGDRDRDLSLSRALVALGDDVLPALAWRPRTPIRTFERTPRLRSVSTSIRTAGSPCRSSSRGASRRPDRMHRDARSRSSHVDR